MKTHANHSPMIYVFFLIFAEFVVNVSNVNNIFKFLRKSLSHNRRLKIYFVFQYEPFDCLATIDSKGLAVTG